MQPIDNIQNLTSALTKRKYKYHRLGRVFVKKAANQKETFRIEIDWSTYPHPAVSPVNEDKMKIEEKICVHFGCGKKLTQIEITLGKQVPGASKERNGCFFRNVNLKNMLAIDFPQRNVMLAENQPEYETLPVFCEYREVIVPNKPNDPQLAIMTKVVPWSMVACFELNKDEIDEIVRTGKLWYRQMLFGGNFQPIDMSTQNPFTDAVQP